MDEWAVQVLGADAAIERLANALGPDVEVRNVEGADFLVRRQWQHLTNWEEVDALGRATVKQVNGLFRIRGPAIEPIRFGGVARLKADGGREFYDAATVEVRMTGSAIEELIGPDGKPVPPPPDPLQQWLVTTEGDPDLQEAIGLYASAADWVDLYKVYEFIRSGLGGQTAIEAVIGASTRSRLTQTANHHRHADKQLPSKPVTFDEAERLIARLLEEWLGKA